MLFRSQSSMPNLSNVTKKKMFEGYGPLGSFSSKIDIAHALGFIDARASRSLHAVREIRNEFAHSEDGEISFHHPSIVELCKKLPNKQNKDRSLAGHFIDACKEVNESLVKCIESNLLVKRPNGYSRNQGG